MFVASDPVAMEEWGIIIPQMEFAGTLSTIHRMLIATYCLAVSRLVAAQAVLAEGGLTHFTKNGDAKRPEVIIVEAASREIRSLMSELCITPGSQSRAVVKPKNTSDDKRKKFFGTS